jgi:plasmid replication initiation protein
MRSNSLDDTTIDPSSSPGVFAADDAPVAVSATAQSNPLPPKVSRDEMNLAEFPLTVLSKRVDPSVKTLEFSDYVKGKNGELLNRKWIITGADKFGLPTSSDDEVLLGLLKLTADDGLQNRKVHFTRYELLKILRWTTEGRSYSRLQNALDRLSGVRIKATNAFYDNETKLHSTRNFGIIDAYEINDGRDTQPSFFSWSEVLFKSFQVGFIKKLDLEFYLDLQSAVSKRLYRYLDKHFWYRSRMQVNLFVLAHEKIGISRNYVYASSLRQQLEPALEELRDKGMLSDFEFVGKGKSTEVVLVAAHAPKKAIASTTEQKPAQQEVLGADHETLAQALIERGLAEKQARRLTAGQGSETLERMQAIITHFDSLMNSSSPLVSRSPTGFLYRAIERPFDFTLPGDKKHGSATDSSERPAQTTTRPSAKEAAAERANKIDLEVAYLMARKTELDRILSVASAEEQSTLRSEVETALQKLRAHISPQRFVEAVQHGVEQRLLEHHGFPDLDAWIRDNA